MSGKGSARRPAAIHHDEWAERWARTFSLTRDGQVPRAPEPDEERPEPEEREP